jgi:hypothetical protein
MPQNEKDKTKLLMNSNEVKNIRDWLLKDFINDYPIDFLGITISLWKTFPFIIFIKGHHKIYKIKERK